MAEVWAGFVYYCPARAAAVIEDVVRLIRTLITAEYVPVAATMPALMHESTA